MRKLMNRALWLAVLWIVTTPSLPVSAFAWSTRVIDASGGELSSLAVTPGGIPHISYISRSGGSGGRASLKYATRECVTTPFGGPLCLWDVETVDAWVGSGSYYVSYTSIALDTQGLPHITYINEFIRPWHLFYARKTTAGTWIIEPVGPTGGWCNSIALDSGNLPQVSFNQDGSLKHARKTTAGAWSVTTVDYTPGVGLHCSMALDSSGIPHISYYDSFNGDLKYARKSFIIGSGWWFWQKETVDSPGDVGLGTSIAVDSSGLPHVAYYDRTNGDLKYARRTASGSWVGSRVDWIGDVGSHTSMALDSSDNPRISYYDFTYGNLKYAFQSSPLVWSVRTVDSVGNVGLYTSIALDSSGNPYVSYYDMTNGDLKFASGIP